MHCSKIVVALAVAATAILVSAGVLAAGSGSALAPEPAKLASKLDGTTGAIAVAIYVNSTEPTKVAFFPSSFVNAPAGPPAGAPCSSVGLAAGVVTTHVIQVITSGSYVYRRCL